MGKIKTEGRVTLEFDPDLYELHISVSAEGKTSGAAVTAGKKQTESLLQTLLDKLQIRPEQISAESENTEMPRSYGQNVPDDYRYTRSLLLKIPAENVLREAVTALLAEMDCVTYSVEAKLADESKQQQAALDAAVQCAKEKAERTAHSLGCRVSGFEEICTDGMRFSECGDAAAVFGAAPRAAKNLAADLNNPKIKISGEVTVVWLTEPLA